MVKIIEPGEILVSETDLNGYITYGNEVFSEVCEFDDNLMIGFNHNIIRHPDMPSEVFEDLWKTIESDKEWNGIIKNQSFNGRICYWVKCNIKPIFENGTKVGYVSIRRQATDLEIDRAMEEYGIDYD